MKKSRKNIKKLPIEQRAELAMREAVAEVIKEHRRIGRPLAIWKNEKVVMISANKVNLP